MSEKRRLSDANEAGRPSAPESQITADVAALSLQATPKSQGSGSYTATGGFTSTRVQEVWPWIAHDGEKHDTCAIAALQESEPREQPSPVKVDRFYIDTAHSIHRSLSLKGRGTYVVRAHRVRSPDGQSPEFVAKFSWADCSRLPEQELVQRGIDRAAGNEAVTKHMPHIAHSFEFPGWTIHAVRLALDKLDIPPKRRLRPDGSEGAEVYRILPVTIVERMKHLSTLSNERFLPGWFQVLIAHYHNWRNGVQHRDISLGNLMCRGEDKDPVCAVLNDWDLGIDAKDANLTHAGFKVTGTVPFMAIDLLTEKGLDGRVAVLYRHDLEAFIWVLTSGKPTPVES
ncbi:hypothetical protein GY45DRAFT_1306993 [Cubamyces sp. BRFM 1775]|nr:hypothetical protein GY45DRAFT_1306993 [Cubamyces sp. BRFM 1775]